MTRIQITAIVSLAVTIWGGWLYFAGYDIGIQYLQPFTFTVTATLGIVTIFNLYLWHLPIIRMIFGGKPNLNGYWQIEIKSNFVDEKSGDPKIINACYRIHQTYLNLSVRLHTNETTSKSIATQLKKNEDGEWILIGNYLDTPSASNRNKSQIHYGSFKLVIPNNSKMNFFGQYWTDRKSSGDIKLVKKLTAVEGERFINALLH
ncbi:hypothetical protein [Polynucleobacter sp. AP-Nino-20-G2]|uniref:Cap15 family cyclic dinucleotide receptor domain-containing protein n=1 Tax=Polynucleobacter sp. AP-Nino-20-G2 TaxID=2576917 RepID=UPI001BFDCA76|nr:hypothetical protein [Polynucleobacter sp. AP-Nino-20-G2]QWE17043.1 hypothetical protein FD960_02105 [Polynucleobacter sp. AP-Nino-20-G2]